MPQWETRSGCHRVFTEHDACILDVAEGQALFARINARNCARNPKLRAELLRRCDAVLVGAAAAPPRWGVLPGTGVSIEVLDPETRRAKVGRDGRPIQRWIAPVNPVLYVNEPHDVWRDLSSIAERSNGQTWIVDCDCVSPVWTCYWHARGLRAGCGVTQPQTRECPPCLRGRTICGFGMAHAYSFVDLSPVFEVAPDYARRLVAVPGVHPMPSLGEGVYVWDGSVIGGMGDEPPQAGPSQSGPPAKFYGQGEAAHVWLEL